MSVTPSQLRIYGCVNSQQIEGVTTGGAVDLSRLVSFADMIVNGPIDFVSTSASDTAVRIQVAGLDAALLPVTPSFVTLTGQTKVSSQSQVFNRLLYGAISGASATGPLANPGGTSPVGSIAAIARTLTLSARTAQAGSANMTGVTPALFKLQAGDGTSVQMGQIIRTTGGTGPNQMVTVIATSGTGVGQYGTDIVGVSTDWAIVPDATTTYEVGSGMLFERLPNPVTSIVRPFSGITADAIGGSVYTFYDKMFILNTNTSTATTGMVVYKLVDPAGLYSTSSIQLDMAPCSGLNDTGTVVNRQTAPSGIGSFATGAAPTQVISLPVQTAAANSAAQAQGFWLRARIAAGAAPQNTSYSLRPFCSTG